MMELDAGLLGIADGLGVDESFCPVRAMLGAFATEAHFPIPDLLVCSVGAVCDDFSAIAQRLNGMGYPILWWNVPRRRIPDQGEAASMLPGGVIAPEAQVNFVRGELARIVEALEDIAGQKLTDQALEAGIMEANRLRASLDRLRTACFSAPIAPMPALELLIAEMLAIHFCSDRSESIRVIDDLYREVRRRIDLGVGHGDGSEVKVFWVNPVADLRAMNYLEECGGRVCGTDYLFTHALDSIPAHGDPLGALAAAALADPMVGSCGQRADRICSDIRRYGAEAVLISKIPGASHCALETAPLIDKVLQITDIPVIDIEVPPLSDADAPSIRTRIEAMIEAARDRRSED
jgi:benzoyl-CoA reductase/2-hydroxyglutaryl-CoA dehydratase subunit BcrC/BadD/HgdB